jgi:DNA-binding response OmpR family regulator
MQSRGVVTLNDIVIDFDRMELHCGGRLVSATSLEFRLLKFFIDNPNHVFSRRELIGAAWGKRKRVNSRTVDTCIWHLRRKLEKDPASPVLFQTVHGSGYKFVPGGLAGGSFGTQFYGRSYSS